MDTGKFEADLGTIMAKIGEGGNTPLREGLERVRAKLTSLYQRNLVKINHSVMEILAAKHLLERGYDVDVERPLDEVLVCDVYGVKGEGNFVLEIETGFVPPEHALDPGLFNRARTASKIARYSAHSNKFSLATPPTNLLQIPSLFLKPPRFRGIEEVSAIKAICDRYYRNPPVTPHQIREARLHSVYIIDVDGCEVREMESEAYLDQVSRTSFLRL